MNTPRREQGAGSDRGVPQVGARAVHRVATDAGAGDPALLACQLHLIYHGMALSGRTDHDRSAARAAAAALLDTAIGEDTTP